MFMILCCENHLSLSLSLSCVCIGDAHLCWRFELRQLWGWLERIFWNVWQGKKQLSLSLSLCFLISSYSFLYFPMNYNILSLTPTLLPYTAHKLKITRISLLYIYLELIFFFPPTFFLYLSRLWSLNLCTTETPIDTEVRRIAERERKGGWVGMCEKQSYKTRSDITAHT